MKRRLTGFFLIGASLLIVGLVILLVGRNDTVAVSGYGHLSLRGSLFIITPRSLLGYLVSTAGALLTAGGIGYWLGQRVVRAE